MVNSCFKVGGVMGYFISFVAIFFAAIFRRLMMVIAGFLIFSLPLTSLPAQAASVSFSYDEVNDLIGSTLSGLEIRLNNLGRFDGVSHRRRNSSYVRFKGQSLSSFDVEPYPVSKIFGRTHTYYVSDIKSSVIDVHVQDKGFYLSLDFELQGAEMEGRCVTRSGRKAYKECTTFLPNINFTEAKVLARLRPVAHKGSLSFYISSAKIVGDVDLEYCRSWFLGFFCTEFVKIPQRTQKLKLQIASKLKSYVNAPRMRDRIAASIKAKVLGNLATVSSIELKDDEIVIKGKLARR